VREGPGGFAKDIGRCGCEGAGAGAAERTAAPPEGVSTRRVVGVSAVELLPLCHSDRGRPPDPGSGVAVAEKCGR
jgi:hypothetical protein